MRKFALALAAAGVMGLGVSVARGADIDVVNESFERPATPFASPNISNWGIVAFPDTVGVFRNTDPLREGIHLRQAAFMFALAGTEIYQDLSVTYDAGKSYTFTLALEGGGQLPVGATIDLRFYYRDGNNLRVPISTMTVLNANGTGLPANLTDRSVSTPVVQPTDAWANQNIGIQVVATASGAGASYWDMDYARVTSIPEPGSLAGVALTLLGLRRRR